MVKKTLIFVIMFCYQDRQHFPRAVFIKVFQCLDYDKISKLHKWLSHQIERKPLLNSSNFKYLKFDKKHLLLLYFVLIYYAYKL
jgi:hypothetical protein